MNDRNYLYIVSSLRYEGLRYRTRGSDSFLPNHPALLFPTLNSDLLDLSFDRVLFDFVNAQLLEDSLDQECQIAALQGIHLVKKDWEVVFRECRFWCHSDTLLDGRGIRRGCRIG